MGIQRVIVNFTSEEIGVCHHQGQAQSPFKADSQPRAAEKNKAIPQSWSLSLIAAPMLALSKLLGLRVVTWALPAWVPGLPLFLMPLPGRGTWERVGPPPAL